MEVDRFSFSKSAGHARFSSDGKKPDVKNITYFFSLMSVLVVFTVAWMSKGFRDFGAAADTPWLPVIMSYLAFAVILEPILLSESLSRSIEQRTYSSLIVRGCAAGAVICGIWSALYLVGMRTRGWEIGLILIGYGAAIGTSVMAVRTRDTELKWTRG